MPIKTAKDLGDIVRATRKAQGLTQRQAAMTAGVGEKFLVRLEAGEPKCQLERALRVVRALGIRLNADKPQ